MNYSAILASTGIALSLAIPTQVFAASDAETAAFVDELLTAAKQPVVLFALEWCEFCWSLRKLFAKLGMDYRAVDLDSVAYQAEDRGGRIRAELTRRNGSETIPQVYIGGEFIGGCTETLDACKDGSLQARLDQTSVAFDRCFDLDPYSFFPQWLHPR